MKNNGTDKRPEKSKVIGITFYPGDIDALNRIKQEHGLLRESDAVRLAVRETVRAIELKRAVA